MVKNSTSPDLSDVDRPVIEFEEIIRFHDIATAVLAPTIVIVSTLTSVDSCHCGPAQAVQESARNETMKIATLIPSRRFYELPGSSDSRTILVPGFFRPKHRCITFPPPVT